MIDRIDLEILTNLQKNARISNVEIARRVRLAPSAVLERIRRLERAGILHGYTARVDPAAVGRGTLAFQAAGRGVCEQTAQHGSAGPIFSQH